MTTININIDDYISEAERKEIARDCFRQICLDKFKDDHERIFSNAAHHIVMDEVSRAFDGKHVEHLKCKTIEVINGLSAFTVFDKGSAYSHEGAGYAALKLAVHENQKHLNERGRSDIYRKP